MNCENEENGLLFMTRIPKNDSMLFTSKSGTYIYDTDPLRKLNSNSFSDGIALGTMSGHMQYIVSAKMIERNSVKIFNSRTETQVCKIDLAQNVLGINIADIEDKDSIKSLLIILTCDHAYIHNRENFKHLLTIKAPNNRWGTHDLMGKFLLLPTENEGEIAAWDLTNQQETSQPVWIHKVHNHPIRWIRSIPNNNSFCTMSQRGTILRIFNVEDNKVEQTEEFRRGTDPAEISCISIDSNGKSVLIANTNGSIHIYNIGEKEEEQSSSLYNSLSGLNQYMWGRRSKMTYYLKPGQIYGFFQSPSETEKRGILLFNERGQYYKIIPEKDEIILQDSCRFVNPSEDPFKDRANMVY